MLSVVERSGSGAAASEASRGRLHPEVRRPHDAVKIRRDPPSSPERNEDLERRWSDDLPTMAPAQFGRLPLVHRGEGAVRPLLLLQQPARPGRSIEKQYSPGFRAAVLPGMRHAAGHEGAGAGAADRDLLADLERDLAAEDIGHLVAVVMQMERAQCPGGNGLLEQHDAAASRSTQQFERRRSARRHIPYRALPREYNDALRLHR